ncbi:MAG: PAS domain-containing protein [Alphaproteobacteria bacterium]
MAHSGYDVMANFAGAQSTEPFGALFDNDFQPMLLIDPETTAIVDANSAACAFYGYSRAEFVRLKKTHINVAPESEIKNLVKNTVVAGHTRSQFQHRLANGELRDVEDWMGMVAVGSRQLLCSIIRDVTNQRRTEAALRASQAMLATAERIAQVGSWDWDIARNTLVWSEEQCRLFGYAPEDFNEKYEGWMVCVHPDDRKRVQEAIDAAVAGQKVYDIEYPVIGPDGTKRFIHARGEVFQDKDGKPVRMVGTCHNITERRSAEETLRQSQKLESVGQLTGGIAHDFNNLLGVIIGNLDLILDRKKIDAGLKKLVQAALDAALRGGDLTQRLLAFSRKQTLQSKVIYLGERLIQAGTMLRRTLGEQITVKVRAAHDLWPVVADSSQIDNVILNLAINARDAMPKGGAITIDVSNVRFDAEYAARNVEVFLGDYVLLAVADTGEGMPPEVLERAFEPFFTTKEVGKGSGLGLSMVYGFVKQSNGHIKIESTVGRGTTVKIYLPRVAAAAAAEPAPENRKLNLSANGEMILVVEDNDSVRAVAVNQLASLGYRTLKAEGGEAALALLGKHPEIDLMFSDVVMRGGINGYELTLEACKRRPGLKVLLTSGCEMKSADGLDGVEKFELLKKPYRKRDLAQKLRRILALS